jgi:hypothetical protein
MVRKSITHHKLNNKPKRLKTPEIEKYFPGFIDVTGCRE